MTNNTPESKPSIALYLSVAVAIALLVGVGVGVAVSNYQKAEPESAMAKRQAAPAVQGGRDPNVVYSIVKEPENTNLIDITCNFNIKDYITNPYGFKYPSLSGALQWVHTHVNGGLTQESGKKLAKIIERGHWSAGKSTNLQLMMVYRIGKEHTLEGKNYLTVFKPSKGYTFIEVPDLFATRVNIQPASLTQQRVSCLLRPQSE